MFDAGGSRQRQTDHRVGIGVPAGAGLETQKVGVTAVPLPAIGGSQNTTIYHCVPSEELPLKPAITNGIHTTSTHHLSFAIFMSAGP